MSAVREITEVRGLPIDDFSVIKACATGLVASPEYHPVEGAQLVVIYTKVKGQLWVQLLEINPKKWDEGGTCFGKFPLSHVRNNPSYFGSSDVVKTFDIRSGALWHMVCVNAPVN